MASNVADGLNPWSNPRRWERGPWSHRNLNFTSSGHEIEIPKGQSTVGGTRKVFDQYSQPENRLTHALLTTLDQDRSLLVPSTLENSSVVKRLSLRSRGEPLRFPAFLAMVRVLSGESGLQARRGTSVPDFPVATTAN